MKDAIWERSGSLAETFWKNGKADFPIYDMHGHMGTHPMLYFRLNEPESMARHLMRIGVRRLVFCHHYVLFGTMRNAEDVKICRNYPDLYRMYVGIVPNYPENIREDLAQFDEWTPFAVGLKCMADYHGVPLTDKTYEYAFKFANERKLPVLCHTWGRSAYNGGKIMLELVQRYPDIRFFMGHCIFGEWDYAERVVKESSGNVYLELTAVPGERGIVERLVQKVGSDKLLYGTDMPWFDEYLVTGGILSAKISDEDRRNIFYRNAERLLGKDF